MVSRNFFGAQVTTACHTTQSPPFMLEICRPSAALLAAPWQSASCHL